MLTGSALGHLQAVLPGYEPRPGQAEMARAVGLALQTGSDLLVEAGTGTGKTLAYLVPVLQTGRRLLVATATRQLQNQIVQQDLPLAQLACGRSCSVAVLKGRANYICHHRLLRAEQVRASAGTALPPALLAVRAFAQISTTGDRSEVLGVAEADPLWPEMTSTADNCLGSQCPQIEACFVVQARRQALQADVVVVNHHLLLADYALRDRFPGGGLLPSLGAIVIDEAHLLAETATSFFGCTISNRRTQQLTDDLWSAAADAAGGMLLRDPALRADVHQALTNLADRAAQLWGPVERLGAAGPLTPAQWDALQQPAAALDAALWTVQALAGDAELGRDPQWAKAAETLYTLRQDLATCLPRQTSADGQARWVQQRGKETAIISRPVQVGLRLAETLLAESAVRIFTSATLATAGSFELARGRLGLPAGTRGLVLPSPFDYPRQACLYVPPELPEPFAPQREQAVAQAIDRLAMAAAGGVLALFSSHRALGDAADRLRKLLPFTVLVQGDRPKEQLLEEFVHAQPAVLLATLGFWHGVDLPAEALRVVVLDKIPFPPPDDPLLQARAKLLQDQGRRPFDEISLPAAEQTLRQGFGRLLRSHRHRGVVAVLDPRLLTKSYGRALLAALPPATLAVDFAVVAAFLARGPDS